MKQYDNTNTGSLWPNERREKDTHPNVTGTVNINGVEYWASGWTKEHKGKKFLSLSFKPKEDKPQAAKPELNDDIPF